MTELFSIPILSKILLVLVAVATGIPLTFWAAGKKEPIPKARLAFVAALHSLWILLMLLVANHFTGFTEVNVTSAQAANAARKNTGNDEKGRRYINDHFILINTSKANYLLPDSVHEGENASRVITDRKLISAVLQTLARSKENVDLVVCDLVFPDRTPFDTGLRNELLRFYDERKILLASGTTKNTPELQFQDDVMADASQKMQDGKIAYYNIFTDSRAGIPYAMYERIQQANHHGLALGLGYETSRTGIGITYDGFIPLLRFYDEQTLYADLDGISDASHAPGLQDLGFLATDFGSDFLKTILAARKQNGKRNIIFIGNFDKDHSLDVHRTSQGALTGPTILINLFYEIEQHRHYVRVWPILFLCLCFAGLTFFIILRVTKPKHPAPKNRSGKRNFILIPFVAIGEIVAEEWHFIVFSLLIFILDYYFEYPVNLMPLIPYFVIYEKLLQKIVSHGGIQT